jgi:hypothetical protein
MGRTIGYPVGRFIRNGVTFLVVAPLKTIPGSGSKFSRALGRYIVNILISIDQFFNVLFLGDPDETISSRLGKLERNDTTYYFTRLVIDFLDGLDPGHAKKSIEDDEGSDAVMDVLPTDMPDLHRESLRELLLILLEGAMLKSKKYSNLYWVTWKTGQQLEIKDDADAILQTAIRRLRT